MQRAIKSIASAARRIGNQDDEELTSKEILFFCDTRIIVDIGLLDDDDVVVPTVVTLVS